MKLDTQEEINKLSSKLREVLEARDIDIRKDEYRVIQMFNDGQAISIVVEDDEDGERKMSVEVTGTVFILDKIDGTLNIFN